MTLRDYQTAAVDAVSAAYRSGARRVLYTLPTGGGKTRIFTAITERASATWSVWICVPRRELLEQASASLSVPHGTLRAGEQLDGQRVQIVSADTLVRRLDTLTAAPDLLIVDEAHVALSRQRTLLDGPLGAARWLGVTATPERLDGRGLGEVYQQLIAGPTIGDLVAGGYLSGIAYYAPPTAAGISALPRSGTEIVAEQWSRWLDEHDVYGDALEHWRILARDRQTLVYCRSVADAHTTARIWTERGVPCGAVDGGMSWASRSAVLDQLRSGELRAVASCDLLTYGLDVPQVSAVVLLRRTHSLALYLQMIGRGLRVSEGKTDCVVLDHTGSILVHGHPAAAHEWRLSGRERTRRSQQAEEVAAHICPLTWQWCQRTGGDRCDTCPTDTRRTVVRVEDGALVAVDYRTAEPKKWARGEYADEIARYKAEGGGGVSQDGVDRLVAIAGETGNGPGWVYRILRTGETERDCEIYVMIGRALGYHPGWAARMCRYRRGAKT